MQVGPLGDDVVVVRCYSSRRASEGYRKRGYDAEQVDAIAAYCAALDRAFYIPVDFLVPRRNLQLRLAPSRNNQESLINWADNFDFAGRLTPLLWP